MPIKDMRTYHREWARKHRARLKAKRMANHAKVLAYEKAWRDKNRSRIRAYGVAYEKANKPRKAKHYRSYRLKSEYGLSELRYQRLAKTQGWLCLICDDKPDVRGEKLVIDHDHSTGEVRGLICRRCNTGLGYFRDNANFLRHAVHYLNPAKRRSFLTQKAIRNGTGSPANTTTADAL
jgi:hypothetical protein